MNHIAIFDIGKTNKKAFVFDEAYQIVWEQSAVLPETTDEDGDSCEDLPLLKGWVSKTFLDILEDERFEIRAVNCSAYGASFVHLDENFKALTPLYNYLKPFPEALHKRFFNQYGNAQKIALETASPILGSLNSGLQLYRLKKERPEVFGRIKWSLHLPQYIASLLHNQAFSEITSIGCHTLLWDFQKNGYHDWVKAESITEKLPPLSDEAVPVALPVSVGGKYQAYVAGAGLHDSSSALIPYLACFDEPFLLLSTGTWCISLNPFNDAPLSDFELQNDCLCYLTPAGKPVKAARFFGGNEHEKAVERIALQHGVAPDFYKNASLQPTTPAEMAYLDFMRQLLEKQVASTLLAIGETAVKRIFVDGGFSKNTIFMQLLAARFPQTAIFAAEAAQATALGAAIAIHHKWNSNPLPQHLISLKKINTGT